METRCLLAFSGLGLRSAGGVLLTSNPVHSVLFLVLTFRNGSGLMRLLGAEFRALLFIVVYVGAIAVLFLFVVMMLNLAMPTGAGRVKSERGLGRRVGGLVRVEGRRRISTRGTYEEERVHRHLREGGSASPQDHVEGRRESGSTGYVGWRDLVDPVANMETLGQVLYTEYALYVVLAGFVLLVAMIGAIVLTLQERSFAVAKRQQAYQQIARDASRAIMRVR